MPVEGLEGPVKPETAGVYSAAPHDAKESSHVLRIGTSSGLRLPTFVQPSHPCGQWLLDVVTVYSGATASDFHELPFADSRLKPGQRIEGGRRSQGGNRLAQQF
jgi:hypothetical protein